MLLKEFIEHSVALLEAVYPQREARNVILCLCEDLAGIKPYTYLVEPQMAIPAAFEPELESAVSRLVAGEPLQYITGKAQFYSRTFNVAPGVLIPRPETELLVEHALAHAPQCSAGARVLDLCTGSGCIAWSLSLELPGSEVVAVDISDVALEQAAAQPFEASRRPEFVKADVLDVQQPFPYGEFDILVSNPPYIMDSEKVQMRPNVLEHEPHLALFVPDSDPLVFYRAVASWAMRVLRPGGYGIVEINEQLPSQTAAEFTAAGLADVDILADIAAKPRFVSFKKP